MTEPRATQYLSTEDLLRLMTDLGVGPVHDLGLLDSAAHRPAVVVFGREAYVGLDAKAAVLLESIVGNHPLIDGNKRLGWLALVVFFGLNGVTLDAPDDDAFDVVMSTAQGLVTYEQIAAALAQWHSVAPSRPGPTGALAEDYAAAWQEWNDTGEAMAWDSAVGDGITAAPQ